MRRFAFSSIIQRGRDGEGATIEVRAVPAWGGYLSVSTSAIDSKVFRRVQRFIWSEVEWVGWIAPVRIEPSKADWAAFSLDAFISLLSRDPTGAWLFAPGMGSHGAILQVAPRGGPWDNPGPNNPRDVRLPFLTDRDQSDEVEGFLQRTAAAADVSFRRGRRQPG
jgi:hypothetical protein